MAAGQIKSWEWAMREHLCDVVWGGGEVEMEAVQQLGSVGS